MPDLIEVSPWKDGAAFRVKVHAGSRRRRVAGVHDGAVKVEIEAAPERGKANRALLAYWTELLERPAGSVELLGGELSTRKRLGARGLPPAELLRRLERLAGE